MVDSAPGPADTAPSVPPSPGTPTARWRLDTTTGMTEDRGVPPTGLVNGARIDGPGFDRATFPNMGSLLLDGDDAYARLSATGLPGFGATKTVSVWFWVSAVPTDKRYMVVFAGSGSVALEFLFDGGNAIVYVGGIGDIPLVVPTGARARAGWNHMAYTYDTMMTQTHVGYLNGAVGFTRRMAAPNAGPVTDLLLGTVGGATQNFGGRLDDLRVYNRALSAAEIGNIYLGAP